MKRRALIKNLSIYTSAFILLPSCFLGERDRRLNFQNIPVTDDEEKFLAELSNVIIPEDKTPGAKSLRLHLFVLKMANDCLSKEDQTTFLAGLTDANDLVYETYKKSFSECSGDEKHSIVKRLEAGNCEESILKFYGVLKQQLLNGYTNSKYFMTNVIKYELIPGAYEVHFPVA